MRQQVDRDEQTVTIVTALALLGLVLLLAAGVGLLLEWIGVAMSERVQLAVLLGGLASALLVSGHYLARHRRP